MGKRVPRKRSPKKQFSDSVSQDKNPRNKFSNQQRLVESADMRGIAGTNDPGWYADSVDLRSAYFSYPFASPLGINFQSGNAKLDQSAIPGVMAYYFVPTIGVTNSASDAVNVAAQRLYSYVRYANSGHANYDATDLMIYLLAMDSIEMYAEYLKRVYGMLLKYSKTNWYTPDSMLIANGVNPKDLQKHIPDLLGYIRLFIAKASALAVPANVSLNKRHAWMCRHMWVDNPNSSKAQTYMFVPSAFYRFMLDSTGAGKLAQTDFINPEMVNVGPKLTLKTFDQLVKFGDQLLDSVIAQEDFGIMSGDIMKAFPNSYRIIDDITQDWQVPFDYSAEVLSQIENATVYSSVSGIDVTQVTPTPGEGAGYLQSNPIVGMTLFFNGNGSSTMLTNSTALQPLFQAGYLNTARAMLNFHHENPTQDEVAVATRLMVRVDPSKRWEVYRTTATGSYTNLGISSKVDECGSEIICGAKMYFKNDNANNTYDLYVFDVPTVLPVSYAVPTTTTGSAADIARNIQLVAARLEQLATFDWHHGVLIGDVSFSELTEGGFAAVTVGDPQGIAIDADTYTWIDSTNIANMHRAALINEIWTPST